MSRLAYLAGPVDQTTGWETDDWVDVRKELVGELNCLGFDVFRPDQAFTVGPTSAAVQSANNAVIDVCQAGVVCLPAGVPTLGTPVEIERLLSRKIPVLIVTDLDRSVQLRVWESQGADTCSPRDLTTGLMTLAHRSAEQSQRPKLGEAMRQLNQSLKRAAGPSSLVFERAESKFANYDEAAEKGIDLLPRRSYADDAGLDLIVAEDVLIDGHEFVDVPCGVKVDIPNGYWALITGRSSTLRKRGLLVSNGVIDAGWTGELFAGVQNLRPDGTRVSAGERIAQLILLPAPVVGFAPEWGRVPKKERGERGFGSSGV